ncbi:MAG: glycosyltransferase family 4 protein [bacterium]|nr:glycosyltransferase family 4 protein [bacterium]
MKKIVVICNSLVGLMCFRKELLEKLIKEKYKVTVIAPNHKFSKDLISIGIDFIPIDMELRGTNPIKDLKLIKTYKKILKKENPDVVLTYTIKPNVYAGYVCGKLKIPYIANVTGLGTSLEQPGLLQKLTLFLYKKGLKKAKCVFFQNENNLNFMLNHKVIKENYQLIPGSGVNLNYHKLLPYPKDKIIRFLFISRILYEKGIDDYLECAKYIKKKYSNTEFHILGECSDNNYLKKINNLQNENIVIYHGQVDDIRKYQKISNCTIHPSFHEGMSNAILESCAAGRPVITTDRSGCVEIVEDGYNGFIFECQNLKMLIDKVENFINLSLQEKEKLGLNARNKVKKEFDRNIVIKKYMECIRNVV